MSRKLSEPATSWTGRSSFVEFYNQVFRPSAAWHLSEFRMRIYDQAVARLIAHCGGESPTLGDVSDELVDELLAAQLDNRSPKWRQDIGCCLRKIIRAWNPLACWRDEAPPAAAGSLREHFEQTYLPERLTGARAQTLCEYRASLKKLNDHVGRDVRLRELTDTLIASFLTSLIDAGRSPVTANKYRAMLLAVWRNAAEAGLVKRGPRLRKLRQPRNSPDAWSVPELRAIFEAAGLFAKSAWYGPVPCNMWWVAALQVAWETAIRRRSLFAITHDNIELKDGTLYVAGEDMKDGDGQDYQLSRGCIKAVGRIWHPRRKFIFRCDLSLTEGAFAHKIERDFKRILEAAGVARSRRRGLTLWHKLRRSTATAIAAQEGIAAATKLLGHSTEVVTTKYIDKSQLPKRDVTEILPRLHVG
jgi:site-specific recombinase XerD